MHKTVSYWLGEAIRLAPRLTLEELIFVHSLAVYCTPWRSAADPHGRLTASLADDCRAELAKHQALTEKYQECWDKAAAEHLAGGYATQPTTYLWLVGEAP